MTTNHQQTDAERLTVYVSEAARHRHKPLYEWLVEEAARQGLCGATATRAMCGFGRHGHIHHQNILALAGDLPVIVEMIDTPERIDAFIADGAEALAQSTYVREKVRWHSPVDPG